MRNNLTCRKSSGASQLTEHRPPSTAASAVVQPTSAPVVSEKPYLNKQSSVDAMNLPCAAAVPPGAMSIFGSVCQDFHTLYS